jgi:hypothetical protein
MFENFELLWAIIIVVEANQVLMPALVKMKECNAIKHADLLP